MDETEEYRRKRQAELNSAAALRKELEDTYGQVWNTDELATDFDVKAFVAPFVLVVRKKDGKRGTLEFQHMPRFYFSWKEDL